MNKQSSRNSKPTRQTVDGSRKQLIGLAIGIGAAIMIAIIAYFVWPKPATVTTKTEVKIEDLLAGTGKEVKVGDAVLVEYTGKLEDGSTFDTSLNHEQPFEFVLGRGDAVAGLEQGLIGMKVGGKRKITIPPDLGYGAKGALGGRIPPNSTLIFEVELLDAALPAPPPAPVTELKIEDLVVGTGQEAKAGDVLTIHYTGWLQDGTQFESSLDEGGHPIQFVLGQGAVIEGWDQGIKGMKVGGKRRLIIPPVLGYGAAGGGNVIPPNAVLIFEVELLKIN